MKYLSIVLALLLAALVGGSIVHLTAQVNERLTTRPCTVAEGLALHPTDWTETIEYRCPR